MADKDSETQKAKLRLVLAGPKEEDEDEEKLLAARASRESRRTASALTHIRRAQKQGEYLDVEAQRLPGLYRMPQDQSTIHPSTSTKY